MSPSALARQNNAARQQRWRDRQKEARQENSLFRAATAVLRAKTTGTQPDVMAKRMYGADHGLDLILRAASSPATLFTPGWAAEAGHNIVYSQLIQKITALSAAANLMERGLQVDLSNLASITIPGRKFDPAAGGAWIAEGAPIPVRGPIIIQGPKLSPHKLAVITTYTREMAMADSIEDFVTAAIKEAAAALLDQAMFSTTTGDPTQPDGILAGATIVPPSTQTAPWVISTDIGLLVEALAQNGGGLEPVLVAAPAQASALRMWRQSDFFDIYASLALPAGTVVAIESSSFVSAVGIMPRFEVAEGATIHMEDTAPADISSGGTVAAPVKSLFQVDVVGLRMVMFATWGMRNPLHVSMVQGVNW